jgi:hypothetical protein
MLLLGCVRVKVLLRFCFPVASSHTSAHLTILCSSQQPARAHASENYNVYIVNVLNTCDAFLMIASVLRIDLQSCCDPKVRLEAADGLSCV